MSDTEEQSSPSIPPSRASSRSRTPLSTPPLSVTPSYPMEVYNTDVLIGHPPSSPSPLAIRAATDEGSSQRRQYQPKPTVNLRQVEYMGAVDSNLICLICICPFVEPRQVVSCDHVFCKDCLSEAFRNQPLPQKTCPTCRTPVMTDKPPRGVQRLVTQMLDDLEISCPNTHFGCVWKDKRIYVQDHVEQYCDWTLVDCPDKNCRGDVPQKDFHRGCLHSTIHCEHCNTSMLKRDFESHIKIQCPNRMTTCESCQGTVSRHALAAHLADDCPMTITACSGESLGCSFRKERPLTTEHITTCPIAKMAPVIAAQNAKIDEQNTAQKLLARKVEILEAGFTAIQNIIGTGTEVPPLPMQPGELINGAAQTPDPSEAPFESAAHHLLSLHETLREELGRTNSALDEMDGRLSMNMHNDQVRTRKDFLDLNHAVGGMRMQLQWLISANLQARGRVAPSTMVGATPSGSSMGSSSSGLLPRRLSDPNRQDPKL